MARASMDGPIIGGVAVTPNDSTALQYNGVATVTRAIYVGADGNLSLTMADGANVTFTGVKGGGTYPFRASKVLATGTTSTNIVALY